jgi:hypothetical protein
MNKHNPVPFHLHQQVGFVDETGKTYGQLSVIRYIRSGGGGRRKSAMFECICTCGEICVLKGQHLRNGSKTMCLKCYELSIGRTGKKDAL